MNGPDPLDKHPMKGFPQVCFLKNTVRNPNTIVGGNPARPIRLRFSAETIELLESIAWWEWPIEKITRHLDAIVGGEIQALQAC